MAKTGVLLINLGTPATAEPRDVGRYLREFLMDPYVIDIPYPLRWFLVNVLIVPRRSHASSALYRKVWMPDGSPLAVYHLEHARKVALRLGDRYLVVPAMRYQEPSLAQAAEVLASARVDRVIAFPLYPQYSLAATESSIVETRRVLGKTLPGKNVAFIPAFYDRPEYLDAVAEVSRPHLVPGSYDKILFSYHGLPERQVKKTDPTGTHCLADETCCDRIADANRDCYRAQCYATTRELARRLDLRPDSYAVGFQSRLGRTPWIRPFSDEYYRELPKQGVKRLTVLCPSFVADCLETLEEVQIRGQEEFRAHGGESLKLVPSLNGADVWAEAVSAIVRSA